MPKYNMVSFAQIWPDFSLFPTPSLLGCNFVLGVSFLQNLHIVCKSNVVLNVVKNFRPKCVLWWIFE